MKNVLYYAAASTILAAGVLAVSCKKEATPEQSGRPTSAATQNPPSGSTLANVLGTGKTIRDTIKLSGTYFLNGLVYVDTLDVIQIAAGSIIKGLAGAGTNPGGGLVITRGAKIEAVGTATNPVVFTSNSSTPQAGDWSGVVILGRANTNRGDTSRIEGIPGVPPADVHYGGSVNNDHSGILKYVRIEYAGFELSADNEINGLTLGGVGSNTTIDFVEVYKANDDAFEFFGGTVNPKHLIAVNSLDDALDFDNGFSGAVQFALVVADTTRADKSGSNGIESDNIANGDPTKTPITRPRIANLTIIGLPNKTKATQTGLPPAGLPGSRYQNAAQWRRSSQFAVYNSVFLGFDSGFLLDNTAAGSNTQQKYCDGTSVIKGNLLHAFTTPWNSNPAYSCTKAYPDAADANTGFTTANPNLDIRLISPFSRTTANFFLPVRNTLNPSLNSPALTGGVAVPAGLTATTYRGAFNNTGVAADNWATGWSRFNY